MDILSPLPIDVSSMFQSLNECLDTISLDVQQLRHDHEEDMQTFASNFCASQEAQDWSYQEFLAQYAEMF